MPRFAAFATKFCATTRYAETASPRRASRVLGWFDPRRRDLGTVDGFISADGGLIDGKDDSGVRLVSPKTSGERRGPRGGSGPGTWRGALGSWLSGAVGRGLSGTCQRPLGGFLFRVTVFVVIVVVVVVAFVVVAFVAFVVVVVVAFVAFVVVAFVVVAFVVIVFVVVVDLLLLLRVISSFAGVLLVARESLLLVAGITVVEVAIRTVGSPPPMFGGPPAAEERGRGKEVDALSWNICGASGRVRTNSDCSGLGGATRRRWTCAVL